MSRLAACPAPAVWQQFGLGRLPAEEIEPLAEHLLYCPACEQTLQLSPATDQLLAALNVCTETEAPAAAVMELIRRLKELRPTAVLSESTSNGEDSVPDNDDSLETFRFLDPPQEPDEMGRLGHYRVLRVLGAGGMGVVFLADDLHLKRKVAVKVMRPSLAASRNARERFHREAQLTASLSHDHIVSVHEVSEQNGVPYLVMPLLQGESLESRRQRQGCLPLPEALRIARQAAEGSESCNAGPVCCSGWLGREIQGRISTRTGNGPSSRFKSASMPRGFAIKPAGS